MTSQAIPIVPDAFTINGVQFIQCASQSRAAIPLFYGMVLYDGQTKLIKKIQRKLQETEPVDGYVKAEEFNGYYESLISYFIQRSDKELVPISLTRKSILAALGERSAGLASKLPSKQINIGQLIDALRDYDSQ